MVVGQIRITAKSLKLVTTSSDTLAMNLSVSLVKLSHGTSLVSIDSSRELFTSNSLRAVLMYAWKIGPALATGNTVVIKPSEFTPLSALRCTELSIEAGIPPGVINLVNGYGNTVGHAISSHPNIEKVAFTGSTLVGREIMRQAAMSNLKNVTLELGGKSPNIIFDDANLDDAVDWAVHGI